ncbi:unnamed protein product [Brassicogethes aeneus]|uniref:Regulatory protein zeste n=1 Tax=Brassicogethes aeneus TaxID=1431903 RepID=A0A9P0AZY3_BRAAE|nr:unnamed protein product [Brassicogethes aeneus]
MNKNKISRKQSQRLAEFLGKHNNLRKGKISSKFTHRDAQNLWECITNELNAIPGGLSKDWKSWKKTWKNMKRRKSKSKTKNKNKNNENKSTPAVITNGLVKESGSTGEDTSVVVKNENFFFNFDISRVKLESTDEVPPPVTVLDHTNGILETPTIINPEKNIAKVKEDNKKREEYYEEKLKYLKRSLEIQEERLALERKIVIKLDCLLNK